MKPSKEKEFKKKKKEKKENIEKIIMNIKMAVPANKMIILKKFQEFPETA